LIVLSKKLPDQLGVNCYAVSTHPYELVLELPPKKNPGSAYEKYIQYSEKFQVSSVFQGKRKLLKILNVKSILNTVKLFRANSVFQGKRKVAQKF